MIVIAIHLPSAMVADIQALREEPADKIVWRLYKEHESTYGVYRVRRID